MHPEGLECLRAALHLCTSGNIRPHLDPEPPLLALVSQQTQAAPPTPPQFHASPPETQIFLWGCWSLTAFLRSF